MGCPKKIGGLQSRFGGTQKKTRTIKYIMSTRLQIEKFYAELFPFEFVLRFLSHGDAPQWSTLRREIVLSSSIFKSRFKSVANVQEWRSLIEEHAKFTQMEVGAVFSSRPRLINEARDALPLADAVVLRELTFDIDLTDYDSDVRYCCAGSKRCCLMCWPLALAAVRFMETMLRKVFGCQRLVWFYSGRRGVHCWVLDDEFANQPKFLRQNIVEYLAGERQRLKSGRAPSPGITEALDAAVMPLFARVVESQSLFSNAQRREKFFADLDMPAALLQEWSAGQYVGNVDSLVGTIERYRNNPALAQHVAKRPNLLAEVVLKCCYPRLDTQVTVDLAHLIKMPFSLHPATSVVCIPMTERQMQTFDPAHAVTAHACTQADIERGIEAALLMNEGEIKSS